VQRSNDPQSAIYNIVIRISEEGKTYRSFKFINQLDNTRY